MIKSFKDVSADTEKEIEKLELENFEFVSENASLGFEQGIGEELKDGLERRRDELQSLIKDLKGGLIRA